MQSKSPIIIIFILFLALISIFNYVRLSHRADEFMDRVEKEVLARYDRKQALDSMKPMILDMAVESGISLEDDDLSVRFLNPGEPGASARGEVVTLQASFNVEWVFLKKRFDQERRREFTNNQPRRAPSDRGFQVGVNVSRPSRDVGSHRKTIDRAKSGQNE